MTRGKYDRIRPINLLYLYDYEYIISNHLRLQMYYNFNNNITDKQLEKIKEYCDKIQELDCMLNEIKQPFKEIKNDYEKLQKKEIDFDEYFDDLYEIKSQVEEDIDKILSLKEYIKESIEWNEMNKEDYIKYIKILQNNEKVCDDILIKIFKEAIGHSI